MTKWTTLDYLIQAAKFEAMYQSTRSSDEQERDDWAWDIGYDLARASGNVWCDGYCQDEY